MIVEIPATPTNRLQRMAGAENAPETGVSSDLGSMNFKDVLDQSENELPAISVESAGSQLGMFIPAQLIASLARATEVPNAVTCSCDDSKQGQETDNRLTGDMSDLGLVSIRYATLQAPSNPPVSSAARPLLSIEPQKLAHASMATGLAEVPRSVPGTHKLNLAEATQSSIQPLEAVQRSQVAGRDEPVADQADLHAMVPVVQVSASLPSPSPMAQVADAVARETAGSNTTSPFESTKGASSSSTTIRTLDLMLQPIELGRISISIRKVGSDVSVVVRTESDTTRKLIESEMPKLHNELTHSGHHRVEIAIQALGNAGDRNDLVSQAGQSMFQSPVGGQAHGEPGTRRGAHGGQHRKDLDAANASPEVRTTHETRTGVYI